MKLGSMTLMLVMTIGVGVAVSAEGQGPALFPNAVQRSQSDQGRVVAIIVDDLHVGFGDTLTLRRFVSRVIDQLAQPGDLMSVASTRFADVQLEPTFDRVKINGVVSRLMGAALSPAQRADASFSEILTARSEAAFDIERRVLTQLGSVQGRQKIVVIVSPADASLDARAEEARAATLNSLASASQVTLYTIDPRTR